MKRKLMFVLVFLAAASSFFAQGMRVKIDNFEITVPQGWLAERPASLEKFNFPKEAENEATLVFVLYSPFEKNDRFRENANLVVEKLKRKCTLKEYMENSKKDGEGLYLDYTLIDEGKDYTIVRGVMEGTPLQQLEFVKIKGKKAYVMTFSATPESFDEYYATFKEIYKSFKY